MFQIAEPGIREGSHRVAVASKSWVYDFAPQRGDRKHGNWVMFVFISF